MDILLNSLVASGLIKDFMTDLVDESKTAPPETINFVLPAWLYDRAKEEGILPRGSIRAERMEASILTDGVAEAVQERLNKHGPHPIKD